MSILKTDIETFLNTCLEDDVLAADLSEAIKLCLRDISNMGLLNGEDDSITLNLDDDGELKVIGENGVVALDRSFDVPDGYKDVVSILLSDTVFTGDVADARLDSAAIYDPLVPFSGGHEEYLACMAESTSKSTPEQYSEYDGKFFLYPPPDAAYDVLIKYQKYDSQDPDDIEFGDEFSNAIKYGTLYFYAMMKGRERYMNIWGQKYENEKEFRRINKKHQPSIVR
jgi:hypothetical protein